MKCDQIKRNVDVLIQKRKTMEQTWDLIEQYIMPIHGGKFFQEHSSEHEMQWRRPEVFDDTAILGAEQLAASLHGSLASPASQWFSLAHRDKNVNELPEVQEWLKECGVRMYHTVQDSNFMVEAPQKFLDLVGFGNGAITMEPVNDSKWEGVSFSALNVREFYFEVNHKGEIIALYRLLQWTLRQIIAKFGYDGLPDSLKEKIGPENDIRDLDTRHKVIFCIFEREVYAKNKNSVKKRAAHTRPYGYKYVWYEDGKPMGEGDENMLGNKEGGYYEMPVFYTRMRRATGSDWGFGPGHIALPTAITINNYIELVLKAAEKTIDPAILATERGLLTQLDLAPAGVNIVKDIDKSIGVFESRARFDVSSIQIDDLRQQIRRIFKVDQLELKESPAMTAAEVYVRYELMNRLMGPSLGQIMNDWFDKMIQNLFNMMMRAGQFPEPPEAVIESGGQMDIEYVGPMARSQRMESVGAVERWLQNVAQVAAVDDEVLLAVDSYGIASGLARDLDVDSEFYLDKDEFDKAVKEHREMKARMANAEAAAQEAKAQPQGGAGASMFNINQAGLQQGTR